MARVLLHLPGLAVRGLFPKGPVSWLRVCVPGQAEEAQHRRVPFTGNDRDGTAGGASPASGTAPWMGFPSDGTSLRPTGAGVSQPSLSRATPSTSVTGLECKATFCIKKRQDRRTRTISSEGDESCRCRLLGRKLAEAPCLCPLGWAVQGMNPPALGPPLQPLAAPHSSDRLSLPATHIENWGLPASVGPSACGNSVRSTQ